MLISIHQCWISAPKFKSWQWVARSSGLHVMYIFLLKNLRFVTNTVFVFTAWAALVSTHLVMETVTRNDMFLNEGKRCKPNLLSKPLGWKTQQKQISATKFARRRRQEFWPVPHHDAGKIFIKIRFVGEPTASATFWTLSAIIIIITKNYSPKLNLVGWVHGKHWTSQACRRRQIFWVLIHWTR